MPGGTREWGPGRLQCELCWKWFRPAGLSGHKRFYHKEWKEQLLRDVLNLSEQLLARGTVPQDIRLMIDSTFVYMDETELLSMRRRIEALLARHDVVG